VKILTATLPIKATAMFVQQVKTLTAILLTKVIPAKVKKQLRISAEPVRAFATRLYRFT
jgi:hypothetical protein